MLGLLKSIEKNYISLKRVYSSEALYFMRLTQPTKERINFGNVGWVMFFNPTSFLNIGFIKINWENLFIDETVISL